MAIKQAANKPAPRDHSSDVRRYVAMAVSPLKTYSYVVLWFYKSLILLLK